MSSSACAYLYGCAIEALYATSSTAYMSMLQRGVAGRRAVLRNARFEFARALPRLMLVDDGVFGVFGVDLSFLS